MRHIYKAVLTALIFFTSVHCAIAAGHTVSMTSVVGVSCFGGCNGSATAVVSGGVGPFLYSWSPTGGTAATATGLCAGTYTVSVTDVSDFSIATATVNITQPPQLMVTLMPVPATCGFPNGQITTMVSGGVGAYTYMWLPSGPTMPNLSNLMAGTYTLIVTDANGCTSTNAVTVPNVPGPVISPIAVAPSAICPGQSATLTPTVTGGTPPYTYAWSPSSTLNAATVSSPVATPNVSTTYTLTVTDANGCASFQTATVIVNQTVAASLTASTATCNQSNGAITSNITSGTAPFGYSWSNGDITANLNNIPAGQYTLTVTDANGCQATVASGVSNVGGPSVLLSANAAGCTNSMNGSATAVPSGIAPFTYLWNTSPAQTTATATGIPHGNYFVTVTDSGGCITVDSVTVVAMAGNLFMYATTVSPSNCNTPTGAATCYVQGGNPPYSYSWSNGDTTANINGLYSGALSVTVTDQQGCVEYGGMTVPNLCANIITGRVYLDINQDGMYNPGDFPIVGTLIPIFPGNYYASTDSNGMYTRAIYASGNFTVTSLVTPNYNLAAPASGSHVVPFVTLGDTAMNTDFVYTTQGPFQDLTLSLASGVARPGFSQQYTINCHNSGTIPVSDTIFFGHDSILTLLSATPPFDGYTYPNGYWLFNNFAPGQSLSKTIWMQVPTIQNGGYLGRQLIANARIEPTSMDTTSSDNGDDEVDIIVGAYDPNLKECWSPTMNEFGDIWPTDTTLDYTIHFQNTGTDTAFTVVVVDTLPAELDITTFRPGASSHPYTWSIDGYNNTNVITFTFMQILLPDSNRNEPASHGYVQFTIDLHPNLLIGTVISNEAHNYFDFNPAIVTNQTANTIVDPLSVADGNKNETKIYPNPAQDKVVVLLGDAYSGQDAIVSLCDIGGRKISVTNSNGQTSLVLDLNSLAEGVYFITIENANAEIVTQKLIISGK